MKAFIRELVPPLLLRVFKQKITTPKAYKTYKEAVSACQTEAYQNNELVKVVVDKNLAYKKIIQINTAFDISHLRLLIALGLCKTKNSLSVIDFGGGGGYHHTIASKAFGDEDSLKWNVVETATMTKEAQRMASKSLNFFDNIADASKDLGLVDLVFTSNALQYCPSPLRFLKQLTEVNAQYIFITRTAFSDTYEDIYSAQESNLSDNGPGPLPPAYTDRKITYPITYSSKSKAEEILKENYHIRFTILEDRAAHKVGNKEIGMFGYFCVRKS